MRTMFNDADQQTCLNCIPVLCCRGITSAYGVSVEWYWQDTTEYPEESLSQCHSIHHKSHTDWSGTGPDKKSTKIVTEKRKKNFKNSKQNTGVLISP